MPSLLGGHSATSKALEIPALVEGTGWRIERQIEDGDDHAVALRRTGA